VHEIPWKPKVKESDVADADWSTFLAATHPDWRLLLLLKHKGGASRARITGNPTTWIYVCASFIEQSIRAIQATREPGAN